MKTLDLLSYNYIFNHEWTATHIRMNGDYYNESTDHSL